TWRRCWLSCARCRLLRRARFLRRQRRRRLARWERRRQFRWLNRHGGIVRKTRCRRARRRRRQRRKRRQSPLFGCAFVRLSVAVRIPFVPLGWHRNLLYLSLLLIGSLFCTEDAA